MKPHIARITALCRRIEATHGPVPDVDPDLGGSLARALLVLESPGPLANAGSGSGFISPWNDDPSAEHVHNLITSHDIAFGDVSVWNVVPWWLPSDSGGSFRAPRVGELRAGRGSLDDLLDLMPRVRVLVAMGRTAERGLAEGAPLNYQQSVGAVVRGRRPRTSWHVGSAAQDRLVAFYTSRGWGVEDLRYGNAFGAKATRNQELSTWKPKEPRRWAACHRHPQ